MGGLLLSGACCYRWWFNIDRRDAEKKLMLHGIPRGTFLVRHSTGRASSSTFQRCAKKVTGCDSRPYTFSGRRFFYPKMSICSSLFRNPGYATEIEPNINDHSSTLQSDSSPSEAAFSCLCVLYDFMTSPCQWQVCLRSVV